MNRLGKRVDREEREQRGERIWRKEYREGREQGGERAEGEVR